MDRAEKVKWILILIVVALVALAIPAATASAGEDEREYCGQIMITSDREFEEERGVRSGSGTADDPYVISGCQLYRLFIQNTSSYVLITDNSVMGEMVLDWVGDRVNVQHNDIANLLVNQNVPRTGEATSGLIAHNNIKVVGQLRHWDGVFEYNVVGSPNLLYSRAVNFDGFNGALFRNNTIYGYMDARLHGHHHSSSFGSGSHYHGSASHHSMATDHTHRFHEVFITNNTVYSTARYALAYLDTDHSDNDRTAASETDPRLNGRHIHHTRVVISGNRLIGSGLFVNVFNADDENHVTTATGELNITNNEITITVSDVPFYVQEVQGIYVQKLRGVSLRINNNRVHGSDLDAQDPAGVKTRWDRGGGITLDTVDRANILLFSNEVSNRIYGIRARNMTKSVHWKVRDLKTTNVKQDVYWDESVANDPDRG